MTYVKRRIVMMRSTVRRTIRSNFPEDLMLAKRKSIGATMRGMTVIAKDVALQRICSKKVGKLKFQPMQ